MRNRRREWRSNLVCEVTLFLKSPNNRQVKSRQRKRVPDFISVRD